jgi:hypothetical protein
MSAASIVRNSRRNNRDSTRMGRKKPVRDAIQRVPSTEIPPPGTIHGLAFRYALGHARAMIASTGSTAAKAVIRTNAAGAPKSCPKEVDQHDAAFRTLRQRRKRMAPVEGRYAAQPHPQDA